MRSAKTSISKARSYREIADFWDSHDLSDFWDQTKPAKFEVNIRSEVTYYALEKSVSDRIRSVARKRGVSADTLLNLWMQEKLQEQDAQG